MLIVVDTLRADRVGLYGNRAGHTPAIDAIGAEGVVFERCIATAPWTQPSIASLLCSRFPTVHGVVRYGENMAAAMKGDEQINALKDDFTTIVERMRSAGYQTAGFSVNPFVVARFGYAQGFDHFDSKFSLKAPGRELNRRVAAWLTTRDASKPALLYLHYMDVHGPYNAARELMQPLVDAAENLPQRERMEPAELERLDYLFWQARIDEAAKFDEQRWYKDYWRARYDAGVREADAAIAELRGLLADAGIWESAYVILTADHGESLCEHGFWDHGFTMSHHELHVPLVLRWPDVLPAGRRISEPVSLIDLAPTLAAQLRCEPIPAAQGDSLLPAIFEPEPAERRPLFAESVKRGPEQVALYLGDWKLVAVGEPPAFQLFHLAEDPGEMHDLAALRGELVVEFRRILDLHVAANREAAAGRVAPRVTISADERRNLEALGYVGDPDRATTSAPGTSSQSSLPAVSP
ncbi:MAG: Multifunctional alkaline phosphatase superfamily protein [Phycisphaerae bacterium]|nr:Multifunctional alkaline phosphatase superfamily protein [Phycisphaerae bacterium]